MPPRPAPTVVPYDRVHGAQPTRRARTRERRRARLRAHRRHPGARGARHRDRQHRGRVDGRAGRRPLLRRKARALHRVGERTVAARRAAPDGRLALGARRHPRREGVRAGARARRAHADRRPADPLHGGGHRPVGAATRVVPTGPRRSGDARVDRAARHLHAGHVERPVARRRRVDGPRPDRTDHVGRRGRDDRGRPRW